MQSAGKKILLVDDEPLVRRTCQRMLTRLGYEVLNAQSGEEAIALYREHQETISAVLLDLVMPTMSGSTTYQHLRKLNPRAKVILSSGYPKDASIEELLNQGVADFVKKPFGLQELSASVRKVLT